MGLLENGLGRMEMQLKHSLIHYILLSLVRKTLIATPWPVILIIVAGLAYLGSRSWKLALGSVVSLC